MKQRKLASLFLALALVLSLLAGCGNTSNSTPETQQPASTVTDESATSADTEQESQVDENQATAEQLLLDLEGTYQELRPGLFWQTNTIKYGWMPARNL